MIDFLDGKITGEIQDSFKEHLERCKSCSEKLNLMQMAELVFTDEKQVEPLPFLNQRIMATIEQTSTPEESELKGGKVRMLVYAFSAAAAVLFGILIGNLYQNTANKTDQANEMSYLDDYQLESVSFFTDQTELP
jgi:predicted anti-sigma-YlaC factor YlaD